MEKLQIEPYNHEKFAKDFLTACIEDRNFGSMNKNDYEVLLFYLLRKYGNLKGKSNFDTSRILRLSETKVKRLAYESQLIYEYNEGEEETKKRIADLISRSSLSADENKIQFAVEDAFLRKYIAAKLKEAHTFCDFSLNSEVIVINIKAFSKLIEIIFYQPDEKKAVMECAKYVIDENKKKDVELSDLFDAVFKTAKATATGDIFSVITSATSLIKFIKEATKHECTEDKSIPNNFIDR